MKLLKKFNFNLPMFNKKGLAAGNYVLFTNVNCKTQAFHAKKSYMAVKEFTTKTMNFFSVSCSFGIIILFSYLRITWFSFCKGTWSRLKTFITEKSSTKRLKKSRSELSTTSGKPSDQTSMLYRLSLDYILPRSRKMRRLLSK